MWPTAFAERTTPLTRPCDPTTLRLDGSFQGSLGSQFGAVTISTSSEHACQLRGGHPKVLLYVTGKPIAVIQTHSNDIALSEPQVLTIPVTPRDSGPGFAFEWQETCRPKGSISVRVQLPASTTKLRVTHSDRIAGPRCPGSGVAPTVVVSLLGPDLVKHVIN